ARLVDPVPIVLGPVGVGEGILAETPGDDFVELAEAGRANVVADAGDQSPTRRPLSETLEGSDIAGDHRHNAVELTSLLERETISLNQPLNLQPTRRVLVGQS